jgi:isoleucyl-tRNA synthetase
LPKKTFEIKQKVNIAIEIKRSSKEIGSSLEAEIELTLNQKKLDLLKNLDLAEYFIVSKVEKIPSKNDEINIKVKKANGTKCDRCWKILEKKCHREVCPIK